MERLFRLHRGLSRSAEVEQWFDSRQGDLGRLARYWFCQMRNAGDDVLELIHDGCPVACVADVPFGYVNVFSAHANVGFFTGALLPDPRALLQGTGKRMRHVKVSPVIAIDEDALRELIRAAHADIRARLRA